MDIEELFVTDPNKASLILQGILSSGIRSVALDIETEYDKKTKRSDPFTHRPVLLQLGFRGIGYVFDLSRVPLETFRPLLESETIVKIIHNANFEYVMILAATEKRGTPERHGDPWPILERGIHIENIWDTMLVERVLTAGAQFDGYGLDDLVKKYCGVELDKAEHLRTNFKFGVTPSEDEIAYAVNDVLHLWDIATKQHKECVDKSVLQVAKLENDAVPSFGDIRYYGLGLDKELWLKASHPAVGELKEIEEWLNNWAVSNSLVSVDFFGKSTMQWSSSSQLLALLKRLWPEVKSTNDKTLEDLYRKYKTPFLEKLREYRDVFTRNSRYGEDYTDFLHPVTGRLHPNLKQYGADTGRPTCSDPNVLQVPKDKRFRDPFIAGKGFKLWVRDYAACELRILASLSRDVNMVDTFRRGQCIHSRVAAKYLGWDYDKVNKLRKAYPELERQLGTMSPDDPQYEAVKAAYIEAKTAANARDSAKPVNFGVAYGAGPGAIAGQLNVSLDEAREQINAFKAEFKQATAFLERAGSLALEKGFVATPLGRKRFFPAPPIPEKIREAYERGIASKDGYFSQYRDELDYAIQVTPAKFGRTRDVYAALPDAEKEECDKLHGRVAGIRNAAKNMMEQGANADITKLVMVKIRNELKARGYYPLARCSLQVYDEVHCLCPDSLVDAVGEIQERCMIEAAQTVITEVPVVVEGEASDCWQK